VRLFEHLGTVSLSYRQKKQVLIKGGGYEEVHYIGNGFSDDGCIYWRMLDRVEMTGAEDMKNGVRKEDADGEKNLVKHCDYQ